MFLYDKKSFDELDKEIDLQIKILRELTQELSDLNTMVEAENIANKVVEHE